MSVIAPFATFFLIFHPSLFGSADSKCPETFDCGNFGPLKFPLASFEKPKCGLFMVNCSDSSNPRILLNGGSGSTTWYHIQKKISANKYELKDPSIEDDLVRSPSCPFFRNLSLPDSPSIKLSFSPNLTLFACENEILNPTKSMRFCENCPRYENCKGLTLFYMIPTLRDNENPLHCKVFQIPVKVNQESEQLMELLTAEFTLEWNVSEACISCHIRGGQCLANSLNQFLCKGGKSRANRRLLAAVIGGLAFLLLCPLVVFIIYKRKRRINHPLLLSRNVSYDPSLKLETEGRDFENGIAIFSFEELKEATDNFDPSKELGDGGFGTVYYGKLKDGREVAIKRLYEQNCRGLEQFTNEVNILTCLRHPNLVSLYGCTSRRSNELLLVYEYISNGTVADHLHGGLSKNAPLTWDVRMSIAVETAKALAYLHKSDIIHRDVKTNNILLDDAFRVKVADFGLSRLFPDDVSHISTAPHGTPGYVDPEYHQSYKLTVKSDSYSFGVVLIELISSMPAVDLSRKRHEVNLAILAVNRIQRCMLDELIDSTLGFKTNAEVARMTTSVAELAFRCLQLEPDLRPSMDEILEFLMLIQGGEEYKRVSMESTSDDNFVPGRAPESHQTDVLELQINKNLKFSPRAVNDVWISGSTTSNVDEILDTPNSTYWSMEVDIRQTSP